MTRATVAVLVLIGAARVAGAQALAEDERVRLAEGIRTRLDTRVQPGSSTTS